jgi:hypothetical protein
MLARNVASPVPRRKVEPLQRKSLALRTAERQRLSYG